MADIIYAKDLRPGMTFLMGEVPYLVIENSFNKTAMGKGIVKCKVKNLRTGSITIEALTGERFEKAEINNIKMSYSYFDGNNYVFMNNDTFETVEIPKKKMQWEENFISDGLEIKVQKYNDEILGITLPDQVIVRIKEAEDAVQGNTTNNIQKKAWLDNGFELLVPQFIKSGEKVYVRTTDGKYVARANEK